MFKQPLAAFPVKVASSTVIHLHRVCLRSGTQGTVLISARDDLPVIRPRLLSSVSPGRDGKELQLTILGCLKFPSGASDLLNEQCSRNKSNADF